MAFCLVFEMRFSNWSAFLLVEEVVMMEWPPVVGSMKRLSRSVGPLQFDSIGLPAIFGSNCMVLEFSNAECGRSRECHRGSSESVYEHRRHCLESS